MSTAASAIPMLVWSRVRIAEERLRCPLPTCSAARSSIPITRSTCATSRHHEPLAAYTQLARRLGFERFVFVQPSAYGFDNACMLDAMPKVARVAPRHRPSRRDQANTTRRSASGSTGVRGVRINCVAGTQARGGFADHLAAQIVRTAAHLRELGLAPRLLLPGWLIGDLMGTLNELPVEFSGAHMGLYPAQAGPKQPGFQEFLRLAADGSKRCWISSPASIASRKTPPSQM